MNNPDRNKFITCVELGSGWAAVMFWWNNEDIPGHGFWEPWDTGIGRYSDEFSAEIEGRFWGRSEDVRFILREKVPHG